jgi:sigma-B regulation protein RsbU (phosphoserine phosphatase)
MFGTEQLTEIVQQHASLSADELADYIMAEIDTFQDGAEHFDDETLIVLRVREASAAPPAI